MAQTALRVLLAFLITSFACSPEPQPGDTVLLQTVRPDLRIAVVGAGASGLTAALTLKDLGYRNVTVFEKETDVGGKIHSFKLGDLRAELGAVFASPDYKTVLSLADRFGVPYVRYEGPRLVMDEKGVKHTFQGFLLSRYSPDQIRQAAQNYLAVLQRFPEIDQDGFAHLPPELTMNFNEFAARFGFTPVAELARSLMTGFGYDTYETVPAAYVLKLLPWLVKVGPAGLESPPYYVFPDGYQALWRAVAAPLEVKLGTPVTKIERPGAGRTPAGDGAGRSATGVRRRGHHHRAGRGAEVPVGHRPGTGAVQPDQHQPVLRHPVLLVEPDPGRDGVHPPPRLPREDQPRVGLGEPGRQRAGVHRLPAGRQAPERRHAVRHAGAGRVPAGTRPVHRAAVPEGVAVFPARRQPGDARRLLRRRRGPAGQGRHLLRRQQPQLRDGGAHAPASPAAWCTDILGRRR